MKLLKSYFLLALLPVAAFAALPSAVLSYKPGNVHNSCMVESQLFADWFMDNNVGGPNSWAQAVFIPAQIGDATVDHAVALFKADGDFYLWDVAFGAVKLPMKNAKKAGSLAKLAEESYATHAARLIQEASAGERISTIATVKPAGDELTWLKQRLARTRPTLRVSAETSKGVREFIGWAADGKMFLFNPEVGTVGGQVGGADAKEFLGKLAAKNYTDVRNLTVADVTTPSA